MKILQLLAGLMVFATCGPSLAGVVLTGTPAESWSYSEMNNAGHGIDTSFYPTSTSEFQNASFQGYVTYDPAISKPGDGSVPHYFYGPSGDDTYQIFTTYIESQSNLTLTIRFDGDDGHSLFVNDVFETGGGFGVALDETLSLQAGVPVKITLAGHNGPGPWAFGIGLPLSTANISGPLDAVSGLQMNANGDFSTVPEPSSMLLFGTAAFVLVGIRRHW